jgi:RNA-binding protein
VPVLPGFVMKLSSSQKRFLRGMTHHINPVVMVGDKGLSENVLEEIEIALNHHELIKVKLRTDRDTRKSQTQEIATICKAIIVQEIGQVSCFYRRNKKKPVIELGKV